MKVRILHKGLAFILLPLALQIVSFCLLYSLMLQSERLAAAEAQSVKQIMWMDSLATEFANSWAAIGDHMYGSRAHDMEDAESYKRRMDGLVAEGKQLTGENPELKALMEQTELLAQDQYDQMKAAQSLRSDEHGLFSLIQSARNMKPVIIRLGHHLNRINSQAEVERKKALVAAEAERTARQRVKTQIIAGVVADIVLTFALLFLFIKNITDRLNILVANARMIPSGQKIVHSVGGTDELHYLDQAIHQASDDLQSAAAQRKQLLDMVAHDLRSPLQSAKLTLDGFLQRNSDTMQGAQRGLLNSVQLSVGTVISLVEDLLTIDKLEAGKLDLDKDLIDVRPLISHVFETVAGLAAAKEIDLENSSEPVAVEGDESRLAQVLTNLVSNAIKFSPQSGKVTVSTKITSNAVRINVTDEGPGISAEQKEKLFEPFFQTAAGRAKSGYGLGLAIARLIVAAHGGTIGVENNQIAGATFWFDLPTAVDLTDLCEPAQAIDEIRN